MPPHRFLRSLPRYYGLRLHRLTHSGVLHIMAFVTLCECYMGINPELDLWRYFFHIQRPQDPESELMISGGTVIHVKVGYGVDPYLEIHMPRSVKGRWNNWFYLKNNASTLLPTLTSGHPISLPSQGEGVARKVLRKLQTLCENLQQLWQDGLTGMHLMWMFFSHRIQSLQRQRTKMWTYPGPSCPDHPSFEELSMVEVKT
jgi:hypothetical protein